MNPETAAQSMKTTNAKIESLVADLNASAEQAFADRVISVFIMGSLARGGFSESASDIDVGIVVDGPLKATDEGLIAEIDSGCIGRHPDVSNNLSLFWGSVDSLNGALDSGRYPPFDRLDLIDHALLVGGPDIRSKLTRPTQQELAVAGATFALEKLAGADRIEEFHRCELIAAKGNAYSAKTVLFPTRFIYLEKTGQVAGNDVSYRYYVDHYQGVDSDLVALAYDWRFKPKPCASYELEQAMRSGLVPLYRRFIDIYADRMALYGEHDLAKKLADWKRCLKPCVAP